MQVLHTLGSIKRGLGSGVTNPLQGKCHWKGRPGGKRSGKDGRLIETALALASRMQWHRDNDVKPAWIHPRILEDRAKPFGNDMAKIKAVVVLKLMNKPAYDSPRPVTGDGSVEVQDLVGAIATGKLAGYRAEEWFGTFLTKRGFDSRRVIVAFST